MGYIRARGEHGQYLRARYRSYREHSNIISGFDTIVHFVGQRSEEHCQNSGNTSTIVLSVDLYYCSFFWKVFAVV